MKQTKSKESQKRAERRRGFTLIEAVVGMTLMSFFALTILSFVKPVMDIWALQTFQQGFGTEGRLALMRMVREINHVKDRTSISTSTSASFAFTDSSNTAITYALSSGSLTRNGVALAKGVSGLSFTYYDVDNATTTTAANIRRVNVQYTVTAGGKTVTLRSMAEPRNLY